MMDCAQNRAFWPLRASIRLTQQLNELNKFSASVVENRYFHCSCNYRFLSEFHSKVLQSFAFSVQIIDLKGRKRNAVRHHCFLERQNRLMCAGLKKEFSVARVIFCCNRQLTILTHQNILSCDFQSSHIFLCDPNFYAIPKKRGQRLHRGPYLHCRS